MSAHQKKNIVDLKRLQGTTNFYPTYVEGNKDRVTPVGATRPTEFQTIIPRYKLSMSETRNEGTGPNFLEIEYEVPAYRRNKESISHSSSNSNSKTRYNVSHQSRRKVRLDFWI